ncbi:MAG: HAD-IC family P-type ATPase [bacterium]|nr:HAD-IC family P-type ATPase [bacterium]
MQQRIWVPSRFIAWLVISLALAVAGFWLGGVIQTVILVLALLPLLALTLAALARRRPSVAQAAVVTTLLLISTAQTAYALWVVTAGLGAVLFFDALMRTARARLESSVPLSSSLVRIERLNREELIQAGDVGLHDRVVTRPGEHTAVDGRLLSVDGIVFDLHGVRTQPVAVGELIPAGTLAKTRLVINALTVGQNTTSATLRKIVQQLAREIPPQLGRMERTLFIVQVVWSVSMIGWWIAVDYRLSISLIALTGVWWLGSVVGRLSWLAQLARGAEQGVVIKTWEAVRRARYLRAALLDKTGTVTTGAPDIVQVLPLQKLAVEDVIRIAGALEQTIDHPIAKTIKRSVAARRLSLPEADSVTVIPSLGVQGVIQNESFIVGNAHLLRERGIDVPEALHRQTKMQEAQGATIVYVAGPRAVLGALVLKDVARSSAKPLIDTLRGHGFAGVHLLSGDTVQVSNAVAASVGIKPEDVFANMHADRKRQHAARLPKPETLSVGDPRTDKAMLEASGLGIGFMGWGPWLAEPAVQVIIRAPDLMLVWHFLKTVKHIRRVWLYVPIAGGLLSLASLGLRVVL